MLAVCRLKDVKRVPSFKRETLRGLGFESGIPSSRSRETAAATERVTHVDANFTSKLKAGKAKWEEAPADP